MIIKAAGRFLTALLIAVALGAGLYFAMHFIVQPIANQLDPASRSHEERQSIQQQDNPKTEAQSFNAKKFIRGLFSVAKNGAVFVFITVIVVGFRSFIGGRIFKINSR
jgi:uncharacterized protein HemX